MQKHLSTFEVFYVTTELRTGSYVSTGTSEWVESGI